MAHYNVLTLSEQLMEDMRYLATTLLDERTSETSRAMLRERLSIIESASYKRGFDAAQKQWSQMYEDAQERYYEQSLISDRLTAALPDALRTLGFVRNVARRYGRFNDAYWQDSAQAILDYISLTPEATDAAE